MWDVTLASDERATSQQLVDTPCILTLTVTISVFYILICFLGLHIDFNAMPRPR